MDSLNGHVEEAASTESDETTGSLVTLPSMDPSTRQSSVTAHQKMKQELMGAIHDRYQSHLRRNDRSARFHSSHDYINSDVSLARGSAVQLRHSPLVYTLIFISILG